MEEFSSPVKNHHSRKRKKISTSTSNSNHLIGILTRSKSRIYFHQNRSGISRPDPVPRKRTSFLTETGPVGAVLDVNCNNASRIPSIKDLRMRRVFTRDVSSVHEEEEEVEEETEDRKKLLKGSDLIRVLNSNLGDANADELEKSEIMVSKKEDGRKYSKNGLNLKDQGVPGNGSNSKSEMALNRCRQRKIFKTSSSFSYKRLLPYLMDIVNDDSSVTKIEIVDAIVPRNFKKLDGVKSEMMSFAEKSYTAKVKCVVPQFEDTTPSENEDRLSSGGAENGSGQSAEIYTPPEVEQKAHESDMDRIDDLVVKECVQVMPPDPTIFSNKDVGHCGEPMEAINVLGQKQAFKGSEKSNRDMLRQSLSSKRDANSINKSVLHPRSRLFSNPRSLSYRRLLPFLINVSQNNSCDSRITPCPMPQVDLKKDTAERNNLNDIKTENYGKQPTEDPSQNLLTPSGSSSPETNTSSVSSTTRSSSTKYSSNCEPTLVISETFSEPLTPIDLHTEKMPQFHNSDDRKLGPCFYGKDIKFTPSSTINNDISNEQSTSKELGPAGKQKNCLDMGLELHNNNGDPIGRFDMNRSSFQVAAYDTMVSPANSSFRGILKRNPRGCRGLCNCLNCAAFRLHADRAFEFSRNQMHDAEEVVSDLMNELANLRLLLEKSFNDLAAIQLNPVLTKEACNKALEAENLAKERLSQLNYDLNVHCRIPDLLEPKVTFANYIQERAIPVLDSLAGSEKKG